MNFYINSPAYYTQKYGVIDEVYDMCLQISLNIDITQYTHSIDTIGIVPIIAPASEKWKERKYVSLAYRMASISLAIDYEMFSNGDLNTKKRMMLENVLKSLQAIKQKLKNDFDYLQLEQDIKNLIIL